MSKISNKLVLGLVIAIVMVVIYMMIFRTPMIELTPMIGLIIAIAACLRIAAILGWKQGAKYGAIVGATSYTLVGLIRGLFDSNYFIPIEYLWVIPLTGIIIGGIFGAIIGALIGKIFEVQKERFPWG